MTSNLEAFNKLYLPVINIQIMERTAPLGSNNEMHTDEDVE